MPLYFYCQWKSRVIHFGIGTGIVKAFRDFPVIPDKKCLYRERMESADSITSMDKTSRNSVSAVGAEQVSK